MRYLPNAVATSKRLSKPSSVVFWLALALALPAAAAAQDISLNAAAIGTEGTWSPWKRLPFALQAGFAAGHLWPVVSMPAPDDYTPFEHGFELIRLRFGFAWRLPSQ